MARTRRPNSRRAPGCALTAIQAEALAAIDACIHADGRPPTLRELCTLLGTTPGNPNGPNSILAALRRKGFVARDGGGGGGCGARTLRVVKRRDGDRVLIAGAWYRWVPADRLGEGGAP